MITIQDQLDTQRPLPSNFTLSSEIKDYLSCLNSPKGQNFLDQSQSQSQSPNKYQDFIRKFGEAGLVELAQVLRMDLEGMEMTGSPGQGPKEGEDQSIYWPIHAWRILGQSKDPQFGQFLLNYYMSYPTNAEDDWILE